MTALFLLLSVAIGSPIPRLAGWNDGAPHAASDREGHPGACQADPWVAGGRCHDHMEVDHGEVVEWWERRDEGLEHGFTLLYARTDHVTLEVALPDLRWVATRDRAASGVAPDGTRWSYRSLRAWDARHRELQATLAPTARGLRIEVDLRGASFPVTVDPLLTSPAWTATGTLPDGHLGSVLAALGDVDADGYADIAIADGGTSGDPATVSVYGGEPGGLSPVPRWTWSTPSPGAVRLAITGGVDVNADGYPDLLVGQPDWVEAGGIAVGRVLLFLGNGLSFDTFPSWEHRGAPGDEVGAATCFGPDVNADGAIDVIVGAPGAPGGSGGGVVLTFLGAGTGLPGTAPVVLQPPPGSARFGSSLLATGDLQGDGFDDLVVGSGGGAARDLEIYQGSRPGLDETPVWSGTQQGDEDAPLVMGDVDNDGLQDLLVGEPLYVRHDGQGRVALYAGGPGGLPALQPGWSLSTEGQEVGTGITLLHDATRPSLVAGSPHSPPEPWVGIYPATSYRRFSTPWWYKFGAPGTRLGARLTAVGDADGDGLEDLIISAPDQDGPGALAAGSVQLYRGATPTTDRDHDGYDVRRDCDDDDPSISPGALPVPCDGIDQTCDRRDEYWVDLDGDGHLAFQPNWRAASGSSCDPSEMSSLSVPRDDCDDTQAAIRPGVEEIAGDSVDQNCDGQELCWSFDEDGDGALGTVPFIVPSSDTDCHDAAETHTAQGVPLEPVERHYGFGRHVATLDADQNGRDDLLVTSDYAYMGGFGTYWYYWTGVWLYLNGVDPADALTLFDPDLPSLRSLTTVRTDGDVNRDGLPDILLGQFSPAELHVLQSIPGAVPGWQDTRFPGLGPWASFAGDVNSDGYEDIIATRNGTTCAWQPELVVLSGGSTLVEGSTPTSALCGVGHGFGGKLLAAGDHNHDAFDDVFVVSLDVARIELFLGSPGGLQPTPAWTGSGSPGTGFGSEVAEGDFDGDGWSDLVITAPQGALPTIELFRGGPCGLPPTATFVLVVPSFDLESKLNLVNIGDGNGDGADDLVLTGTWNPLVVTLAGTAAGLRPLSIEVYPVGSPSGSISDVAGPVDVNGDGLDELVLGTSSWGVNIVDIGTFQADCAPADPTIHPWAPDPPGDGIDADCDGMETCLTDIDLDGLRPTGMAWRLSWDGTCDFPGEADPTWPDGDPDDLDDDVPFSIAPLDQSMLCTSWPTCGSDLDGDGHAGGGRPGTDGDCADPGELPPGMPPTDCDDADDLIYPGAGETPADGVDSDCDRLEMCFMDYDRDGYTRDGVLVPQADLTCSAPGFADGTLPGGDCNDLSEAFHPGATEAPADGWDWDCDGKEVCLVDADDDGTPESGITVTSDDMDCSDPGEAYPARPTGSFELCFGDSFTGDDDHDGTCDAWDPCPLDVGGDLDLDHVCDAADQCAGDDAIGDSDLDGLCDHVDLRLDLATLPAASTLDLLIDEAPIGSTLRLYVSTAGPGSGPCGAGVCLDLARPGLLASHRVYTDQPIPIHLVVPDTVPAGTRVLFRAAAIGPGAVGRISPYLEVRVRR